MIALYTRNENKSGGYRNCISCTHHSSLYHKLSQLVLETNKDNIPIFCRPALQFLLPLIYPDDKLRVPVISIGYQFSIRAHYDIMLIMERKNLPSLLIVKCTK